MNDRRYSQDHDPALLIDRLAADEIDDDSRRTLFAWLDREPARWRRCALALLEAREMEGAFEDWAGESDLGSTPPAARRRRFALHDASDSGDSDLAERGRRPSRYAMLAMAASVALAFGLGMAADRRLVVRRAAANLQVAARVSSAAGGDSQGELPAADAIAANDSGSAAISQGGESAGGRSELSQPMEAAAENTSSGDTELIPEYVKSQLERRGYRVDSRRQFVSVSLPDGRRALVPVEQWKFSYVGNRAF